MAMINRFTEGPMSEGSTLRKGQRNADMLSQFANEAGPRVGNEISSIFDMLSQFANEAGPRVGNEISSIFDRIGSSIKNNPEVSKTLARSFKDAVDRQNLLGTAAVDAAAAPFSGQSITGQARDIAGGFDIARDIEDADLSAKLRERRDSVLEALDRIAGRVKTDDISRAKQRQALGGK